jgi:hypothetical protein
MPQVRAGRDAVASPPAGALPAPPLRPGDALTVAAG